VIYAFSFVHTVPGFVPGSVHWSLLLFLLLLFLLLLLLLLGCEEVARLGPEMDKDSGGLIIWEFLEAVKERKRK